MRNSKENFYQANCFNLYKKSRKYSKKLQDYKDSKKNSEIYIKIRKFLKNYMNINAYINKVCVYVYVYVSIGCYCCISYQGADFSNNFEWVSQYGNIYRGCYIYCNWEAIKTNRSRKVSVNSHRFPFKKRHNFAYIYLRPQIIQRVRH